MKPRALMLIHHFRPGPVGGAELQAERLATHLAKLGHGMQVLTRITVPHALPEESMDGVAVHRVPFPFPYWVRRDNCQTFRYLFRNHRTYDVLHAHMAFGHAVVATVAARCFAKKCIVKIACAGSFGDLSTLSKFDGYDQALGVLRQADAIVAVSSEVARELQQYGFTPERIVRIPNGVDATYFQRTDSQSEPGKTRFILVGRRHPQKGIDTALHATRILKERGLGTKFELKFYGVDYPEHDFRGLAEALSVTDVAEFLPFQQDVISVYQAAHCFLLPSRGEGLSNALLEAMAMELPVIVTPVSGTQDVVEGGNDAILIPPDAPDQLAEMMAQVIERPDWARQLGLNARKKVVRCFSLEVTAQKYSDLYARLCNSGR